MIEDALNLDDACPFSMVTGLTSLNRQFRGGSISLVVADEREPLTGPARIGSSNGARHVASLVS